MSPWIFFVSQTLPFIAVRQRWLLSEMVRSLLELLKLLDAAEVAVVWCLAAVGDSGRRNHLVSSRMVRDCSSRASVTCARHIKQVQENSCTEAESWPGRQWLDVRPSVSLIPRIYCFPISVSRPTWLHIVVHNPTTAWPRSKPSNWFES